MRSGDATEKPKSAGQRGPFVRLPWPAGHAPGMHAATAVLAVLAPPPRGRSWRAAGGGGGLGGGLGGGERGNVDTRHVVGYLIRRERVVTYRDQVDRRLGHIDEGRGSVVLYRKQVEHRIGQADRSDQSGRGFWSVRSDLSVRSDPSIRSDLRVQRREILYGDQVEGRFCHVRLGRIDQGHYAEWVFGHSIG
jgi:hypothetical protein